MRSPIFNLFSVVLVAVVISGFVNFAQGQASPTGTITCNGLVDVCNVTAGSQATIAWNCSNAVSGRIYTDINFPLWSGTSGSQLADINDDYVYYLECSGSGATFRTSVLANAIRGNELMDVTFPQVDGYVFDGSNPSFVYIGWAVSDTGGSFLNGVAIERAVTGPSCDSTIRTGCSWNTVSFISAPITSNTWGSAINDFPPVPSQYQIKVFDQAGNMVIYPQISPTATPSPTTSGTPTPTVSATPTPTSSTSVTPTPTSSLSPTPSPTATTTSTSTPTSTSTVTPTPTATVTATLSPSMSPLASGSPGPQSAWGDILSIDNPFSGSINTLNDLFNTIIAFLYYIAGPIVVVLIIYAGLMFLFGRGQPEKVNTAKKILTWAIVGLAIILIGRGFIALLNSILDLGNTP